MTIITGNTKDNVFSYHYRRSYIDLPTIHTRILFPQVVTTQVEF